MNTPIFQEIVNLTGLDLNSNPATFCIVYTNLFFYFFFSCQNL